MTVFVSHSHADEGVYSTFTLLLDGREVERWDYEDMAIGRPVADQLREAIRYCDACVFLATKSSLASPWCMAELGAFWGAGKPVMVFLAEQDVAEADIPVQFQGTLWTRDANRIIAAIGVGAKSTTGDVLTPDLVLLLRYLERDDRWILPDNYGLPLALVNGADRDASEGELRGWKRAVRYAMLFLAHQGLVDKQADTSVVYSISEYGRRTLNAPSVRRRFSATFERELEQI